VLCFASSGLLFASTLPCFALPDLASPSIAIPPHRYSPPCLFYAYPISSLPFLLMASRFCAPPFLLMAFLFFSVAYHGLSSAFLLSASPLPYSATLCPCL
jgi:hypothetical protein